MFSKVGGVKPRKCSWWSGAGFLTWSDVKYPASSHIHPYPRCPKGLQGDDRSGPIPPAPMRFSLLRASFSIAIAAAVSGRRPVKTHHLLLLFLLE
jgi:hypothetical protein